MYLCIYVFMYLCNQDARRLNRYKRQYGTPNIDRWSTRRNYCPTTAPNLELIRPHANSSPSLHDFISP